MSGQLGPEAVISAALIWMIKALGVVFQHHHCLKQVDGILLRVKIDISLVIS